MSANCTDGALRLVGGSTDREGRVEVCVSGRQWRTVCTGSQELAETICTQMGYIFEGNGGSMTLLIIPLVPIYRKLGGRTKLIFSWNISRVQTRMSGWRVYSS